MQYFLFLPSLILVILVMSTQFNVIAHNLFPICHLCHSNNKLNDMNNNTNATMTIIGSCCVPVAVLTLDM